MLNITSFNESIALDTEVLFVKDVTAPSMFPDPEPFAYAPSVGAPICTAEPTVLIALTRSSTYSFVAASVLDTGAEPNVT